MTVAVVKRNLKKRYDHNVYLEMSATVSSIPSGPVFFKPMTGVPGSGEQRARWTGAPGPQRRWLRFGAAKAPPAVVVRAEHGCGQRAIGRTRAERSKHERRIRCDDSHPIRTSPVLPVQVFSPR